MLGSSSRGGGCFSRGGGGCFSRGFVQEEQIVAQSNDFTIRLHKHRQRLFWNQGISYQGVYMDACWSRDAAEKKIALRLTDIHAQRSNPLTILAVDAPSMHAAYCSDDLQMLAAKILIIFAAAEQLHSPKIFGGLLGGARTATIVLWCFSYISCYSHVPVHAQCFFIIQCSGRSVTSASML